MNKNSIMDRLSLRGGRTMCGQNKRANTTYYEKCAIHVVRCPWSWRRITPLNKNEPASYQISIESPTTKDRSCRFVPRSKRRLSTVLTPPLWPFDSLHFTVDFSADLITRIKSKITTTKEITFPIKNGSTPQKNLIISITQLLNNTQFAPKIHWKLRDTQRVKFRVPD